MRETASKKLFTILSSAALVANVLVEMGFPEVAPATWKSVEPFSSSTFSDETFDDSTWTAMTIATFRNDECGGLAWARFDAHQELSGGNPGAFRHVTLDFETLTMEVAHLKQGAVYDPSLFGSIESVDCVYETLSFMNDHGVAYAILASQSGSYYIGPLSSASYSDTAWQTFQFSSLTASDFEQIAPYGSNHPNFASTGTPIQFGFLTRTGPASCEGGYERTGIDNWSVTVKPELPTPVAQSTSWGRLKALYE